MKRFLLAALPFAMLNACSTDEHSLTHDAGIEQFTATIVPTEGHSAEGSVLFQRIGSGISVVAQVEGLTPNQNHGFHIHQYGDCTAPDGSSAGGHFNPTGERHAGPDSAERHLGDLGNLTANQEGVAHLEFIDERLSMDGAHNILGRGIVIHAEEDDFESQPTGDAGGRIGCGVIGVAAN